MPRDRDLSRALGYVAPDDLEPSLLRFDEYQALIASCSPARSARDLPVLICHRIRATGRDRSEQGRACNKAHDSCLPTSSSSHTGHAYSADRSPQGRGRQLLGRGVTRARRNPDLSKAYDKYKAQGVVSSVMTVSRAIAICSTSSRTRDELPIVRANSDILVRTTIRRRCRRRSCSTARQAGR